MLGDELGVVFEAIEKEAPGNINLESGSVTGGTTVVEILGEFDCLLDDSPLGDALSGCEKTDSASICFENQPTIALNWVHKRALPSASIAGPEGNIAMPGKALYSKFSDLGSGASILLVLEHWQEYGNSVIHGLLLD